MMDKKNLKQLIDEMPKKNLIELIEVMVKFNSDAEQVLLDYCQKHASSENKNMIIEKQVQKHWNEAVPIIDEANTYGGCSDDDEETALDEIVNSHKRFKSSSPILAISNGIIFSDLICLEVFCCHLFHVRRCINLS